MSIPRVSLSVGFSHDGSTRVFTTAGIIGVHTLVEPAQSVCVMAGELTDPCAATSTVRATVMNLIAPPHSLSIHQQIDTARRGVGQGRCPLAIRSNCGTSDKGYCGSPHPSGVS